MKIIIIICAVYLFFDISKLKAQSCGCTSMNNYGVEFPSTGNTPVSNATYLLNLSSAVLTSGNNLHFYFPNKPCNNTVGNPCYGTYQATVNGHIVNSVGGNTVNQHIQIPASFLVVGANNITVKATCGTTVCSLPTTVVNVIAPSSAVASITLASECCTVISGPQHTLTYTGQVRFKMGGTARLVLN